MTDGSGSGGGGGVVRARPRRLVSSSGTPITTETTEHMLKDLENPRKTLTAWELEYIESISDQFTHKGMVTQRQFDILERIYVEKGT